MNHKEFLALARRKPEGTDRLLKDVLPEYEFDQKPGLFRTWWEALKCISTWFLFGLCIAMIGLIFLQIFYPEEVFSFWKEVTKYF